MREEPAGWHGWRAVARIIRTRGTKGDLIVRPTIEGLTLPAGVDVCVVPPLLRVDRFHIIERSEELGDDIALKLSGVTSISDAEPLLGRTILVNTVTTSGVVDERVSLVGRTVEDTERGLLGTIDEVLITGANDVWLVNGPLGEVLIPVIPDVVGEDEIPEEGPLVVTLLPGLLGDDGS